ncbi:hypothetical protein [Runella sp.]|uniref:hypothetical protein n=1 Tax=Runella sp. TaxID=1960881 RepID=UPI0030179099
MKKIATCILIFLNMCAYAQKVNLLIPDKARAQESFAYLGVDNDVIALVENESCDSFFLKTDLGTIQRDSLDYCKYLFRPNDFGIATISYNKVLNGDTIKFAERKIHIKAWPFIASIDGHTGYFEIEKSRLLQTHLMVYALNTGLNAHLKIKRFSLQVKRCANVIYKKDFEVYDQATVDLIVKDLSETRSGDLIIYSNIMYDYFGFELQSENVVIYVK